MLRRKSGGEFFRVVWMWLIILFLPILSIFEYADIMLIASILILLFSWGISGGIRHCSCFKYKKSEVGYVFLAFYCMMIWYFVCLLNEIELDAFVRIVQLVGCFLAFELGSGYEWESDVIQKGKNAVKIVFLVVLAHWLLTGHPMKNYTFIFVNANSFSSVLLCWIVFLNVPVGRDKRKLLWNGLGLFLMLVVSSRGALLSLLVYGAVYFLIVQSKKNINRKFWNRIFLCAVLVLAAFVILYSKLLYMDIGMVLQQLSRDYFGKNFFSGRQKIWGELFELICKRPIIGYGLGAVPSEFAEVTISSHNSFLQTGMQTGVPGILLLLEILRRVIRVGSGNRNKRLGAHAVAFVFAILLHECFEVSLIQNFLVVGMGMWFLLGLGCNSKISGQGIERVKDE